MGVCTHTFVYFLKEKKKKYNPKKMTSYFKKHIFENWL